MEYRHMGLVAPDPYTHEKYIGPGDIIHFMNSKFIFYARSLERILYKPAKLPEPVMVADKKWEIEGKYKCVGGFSGKCIVVRGGILQMFYSVYHMSGAHEHRSFAYAESTDGFSWKKPKLNKDGTNLLIDNRAFKHGTGKDYFELQNVTYDEHSKDYIGLGHCKTVRKGGGTFVARTRDPFKWDRKNFKWLYKNDDIHALLGWDEAKQGYLAYVRVPVYQNGIQKRAIGLSASEDFKKWTDPVLCLAPYGGYNHQIYNMPVSKYGLSYLGFPINYYSGQDHGGLLDTGLAFSDDGRGWAVYDQTYIPRGLPGEWDDSYVMTAAPVEWKDSWYFYYWGANFPHDVGFREEEKNAGSVGLAVLPKNRMLSVACDRHSPGVLGLIPIQLPYTEPVKIVLNAHFPHGSIAAYNSTEKLAIVPKNGMEYYLKNKDGLLWRGLLNALRIELSDAELFSISFEPATK